MRVNIPFYIDLFNIFDYHIFNECETPIERNYPLDRGVRGRKNLSQVFGRSRQFTKSIR